MNSSNSSMNNITMNGGVESVNSSNWNGYNF